MNLEACGIWVPVKLVFATSRGPEIAADIDDRISAKPICQVCVLDTWVTAYFPPSLLAVYTQIMMTPVG